MKNILRRTVSMALSATIVLSAAALSGCGQSKPKATGILGGVDLATLETTDIRLVAHYDVGMEDKKHLVGSAAKWWKDNVGGEIKLEVIAAELYPTKLMAMVSANNSPDLAVVSTGNWMPRFPVAGVIQPVDSFVDTGALQDYEKRPYDEITWNNKHYAMYVMGSWAQCLWYNKTMFLNNGVKTPREQWDEGAWNWENFLAAAKQLTKDTNNDRVIDQWGYANWTPDVMAFANNASMLKSNPDGTVDIVWDQQPYMNALKFEQELMNVHKVTPLDYSFHVNSFKAGSLAMSVGDRSFVSSMCEGMSDEVDNVPLPLGPDQNPEDIRFIGNSLFLGLVQGAKNTDGARAFCAKLREVAPGIREAELKTLGLTDEQLEVCDFADTRSRIVYENGFGTWETDRWALYEQIMLNNTPIATVLASLKPKLEQNIKNTLEAQPLDVVPFTVPPKITFDDNTTGFLTRDGLTGGSPTAETVTDGAISGSSLKIVYASADALVPILRTDESKAPLPSFHRYIIKFDYKAIEGEAKLNLTIRPKATMNSEDVSFGFETLTVKAGGSGSYECSIDVMSESADNVLVILGGFDAFTLLIDNFEIIEG